MDIPDPTPESNNYHGKHVAGICCAQTNNGFMMAGIAGGWYPQLGSKIMALRVIKNDSLYSQYVDDAIIYAAENGAKIINMSFQMDELESVNEAIEYAYARRGCILIASAGNYPEEDSVLFPARNPYVMAVAGIKYKNWEHYGNKGEEIDVTAPADEIISTIKLNGNSDELGYFSGTSQSTAMVSGVSALLLSHALFPDMIPLDIKKAICQNATDIGAPSKDKEFGWGC